MCDPTESESGQLLTIKPCGWYLKLQSDRDRLAGVVKGLEEQSARNLDALRRTEAEVVRMREVLEPVEWKGSDERGRKGFCPCCGNHKAISGHSTSCIIGNALKEVG